MATRQKKNTLMRQLALPTIFALMIGYFVFHALTGGYGAYALTDMRYEIDRLEADLLSARLKRETIEHRIALFRRATLDPDMMDERARAYMNMAHPDELIIFHN